MDIGQAAVGQGFDVARLQGQRRGVIRNGVFEIAGADMGQGPTSPQGGVLGSQLDGLGIVGDSQGELSLAEMGVGPVAQNGDVSRVALQGRAQVGDVALVQGFLGPIRGTSRTGQGVQAFEDQADVRETGGLSPRRAGRQQRRPFLREQHLVGRLRIGLAGQGEGGQLAQAEDVGVRSDPDLAFGFADHLLGQEGHRAGNTAAESGLLPGGRMTRRRMDGRPLQTEGGVQQLDAPTAARRRRRRR